MGTQAQPGIMIQDGKWSVNSLDVSLSNVSLGAFSIKQFEVDFSQPSSTELDFNFKLMVSFPQNWAVNANIDTSFNKSTKAFEINDVALKASGLHIAIGATGLFLTEIDASLQNIFQPSNLIVSGGITVEYGNSVTIFGQTARFFLAQGSFTVDKDMLKLGAQVWIGAVSSGGKTTGVLGSGTGTLTLDWADQVYSLDAKASLLDGVFQFDDQFAFSGGTSTQPPEVLIKAQANVDVPNGIPLIGGKSLGEIDFMFKYDAPSAAGGQAEGFVAAWTRINLIFTHVDVGIEYDFENNKVMLLGSGGINSLKKQNSAPQSKTYVYSQPFTNSDGATQATLTVDWARTFSTPPTSATVSVMRPDGVTVQAADFGSNGMSLITGSSGGNTVSSSTQINVGIVNPAAARQSYVGSLTNGDTSLLINGTVSTVINGYAVSGTGVPDGTTVTYVNGTTLKLSQPATSTVSNTTLTFTNPYLTLPFSPGQTSTSYTLLVTLTSEQAPLNPTDSISTITRDSATGDALVTFTGAAPSNILVGDTITISGSSVAGYNTVGTYAVTEITSNGVVISQPYTTNATGGTMSGWTQPQFSATYHLPPPTILVGQVPRRVTTSQLPVSMPVQVVSGLASNTTVNLYIDVFNAAAGANQDFNGILVARNVPLTKGATTNGQVSYQAMTTVDLSQPQLGLLPIDYYLYAVVNDGTNTPVTSTLTSNGGGGFLETFTNSPVVDGFVTNQVNQDLSGWTVFVDTNGNGVPDSTEASTMTNSEGFYGFYANQVSAGTIPLVVQMFDPVGYTFEESVSLAKQGAAIVAQGNGLSVPVSWDGSTTDTVSQTLVANQLSAISGTVTDATTGGPLGGWMVFLDSNGNGQLDPGELSTQTAADGSYTFSRPELRHDHLDQCVEQPLLADHGPEPRQRPSLDAQGRRYDHRLRELRERLQHDAHRHRHQRPERDHRCGVHLTGGRRSADGAQRDHEGRPGRLERLRGDVQLKRQPGARKPRPRQLGWSQHTTACRHARGESVRGYGQRFRDLGSRERGPGQSSLEARKGVGRVRRRSPQRVICSRERGLSPRPAGSVPTPLGFPRAPEYRRLIPERNTGSAAGTFISAVPFTFSQGFPFHRSGWILSPSRSGTSTAMENPTSPSRTIRNIHGTCPSC